MFYGPGKRKVTKVTVCVCVCVCVVKGRLWGMKMLAPISQLLGSRRLILASGSPRRKQILQNIVKETRLNLFKLFEDAHTLFSAQGFVFDVVPSTFEENLSKSAFSEPWQYAVETSRGKVLEVAERLQVCVGSYSSLEGAAKLEFVPFCSS